MFSFPLLTHEAPAKLCAERRLSQLSEILMECIVICTGKSRIRAVRKKRRTMDSALRIPYSSDERTVKVRAKRYGKRTHECNIDSERDRYAREHRNGTAKSSWPGATVSCTGSRQVSWLADHYDGTPSRISGPVTKMSFISRLQ